MAAIARKREAATPSAETPEDDILPPSRSVGYLVRQTHRALTRALQARIAPHGVSIGMWFFLRALWQEDGISQRELSQRVGMMEPTTASALTNMERKGYVRRIRNRADRRIVNVFLTERGRALRRELLPLAAEVNEVALRGITTTEAAELRALLGKVQARLDADTGDA
ncbi:MAG TPA: MarR family winged helix-turn-helix transcriptional regulator [Stellaceae bacterium]|nr:MarR family winged helix-turn-helix transcriptional regulator [Stellaceae bacterium]